MVGTHAKWCSTWLWRKWLNNSSNSRGTGVFVCHARTHACVCVCVHVPVFGTYMHDRPYCAESTGSRSISEVKLRQAGLVLGWGTTGEVPVLIIFFHFPFSIFFPFPPPLNFPQGFLPFFGQHGVRFNVGESFFVYGYIYFKQLFDQKMFPQPF